MERNAVATTLWSVDFLFQLAKLGVFGMHPSIGPRPLRFDRFDGDVNADGLCRRVLCEREHPVVSGLGDHVDLVGEPA